MTLANHLHHTPHHIMLQGSGRTMKQAALRKVYYMASDDGMLYKSAQDKLREFTRAGYLKGVRRYVCVGLGHATGNEAWFAISKMQK